VKADDPRLAVSAASSRAGGPAMADWIERECRDDLVRFCQRYLRRREDAEDAASEVILRALCAREVPDAFRPWLLRIARNHCLNRLRDAGPRAHETLVSDVQLIATATGPLTNAARADDRAWIESTLAQLSPAERELLQLRYVEDLQREEIATILDLPVSVVKSRLYEAVARLRRRPQSSSDRS
jgi:RNA polymerase sigma-70 factor (ECF subfamily)